MPRIPDLKNTKSANFSYISNPENWWVSADGKRAFSYDSVVGYDYKDGSKNESFKENVLYLYVESGILHLKGTEASLVYEKLKDLISKK